LRESSHQTSAAKISRCFARSPERHILKRRDRRELPQRSQRHHDRIRIRVPTRSQNFPGSSRSSAYSAAFLCDLCVLGFSYLFPNHRRHREPSDLPTERGREPAAVQ
jgi:hypothetical protein